MKANKIFVILGMTCVVALSGCAQTNSQPAAANPPVIQTAPSSIETLESAEPVVTASESAQDGRQDAVTSNSQTQKTEAVSAGETAVAATDATDAELVALLTYLVQEEKLAKDLYTELAQTSGARQFSNITKSEAKHVSSVQKLLSTYGISDPTDGLAAGEFANDELQDLYGNLLSSGSADYAGAIAAGVAVEETDIADIKKMLENELPADVEQVLNSLLSASYNHLAAFSKA